MTSAGVMLFILLLGVAQDASASRRRGVILIFFMKYPREYDTTYLALKSENQIDNRPIYLGPEGGRCTVGKLPIIPSGSALASIL